MLLVNAEIYVTAKGILVPSINHQTHITEKRTETKRASQ